MNGTRSHLGGLMLFANPKVASLPQHHHLFGGHGCHKDTNNNADGGTPCTGFDKLPDNYLSLIECYRPQKEEDVNVLELLPLHCNKR